MSNDELMARISSRVQPTAKPVAEAFRRPSEPGKRTTIYMPVSTLTGLKHAAVEEGDGANVSRLLTRLAEEYLAARKDGTRT
ncbi:MAG: hypothetical protein E6R04_10785 [Spirochaetes bacterium]|nr:MAG: hypothetical protein E6R04_10785 [Spirochaetota bacterium]